MRWNRNLFYVVSAIFVIYVGASSTFIMNRPFLMLGQWLIILITMNIWGTIVSRSIKFGTWLAIGGWFLALIIQQLVVLWIQFRTGSIGSLPSFSFMLQHDSHQTLVGILMILPAIPTGYVVSWVTKKILINHL